MAIRLAIRVDGQPVAPLSWESTRTEISIGRSSRADLSLPDTQISGLHLLLRYDSELATYLVQDDGSLNGSRLNGRRLDSARSLAPGDTLAIGRIRLTVEAIRPPTPAEGETVQPTEGEPDTTGQLQQLLSQPAVPAGPAIGHAWPGLPDGVLLVSFVLSLALMLWLVCTSC